MSTQFSSIWPIDKTLSAAPTPRQSGSGNDGNEGVLHFLQSSTITAEKQSVYSTSPVDWATLVRYWKVLYDP